jgi:hypothetical protein
MLGYNAFDLGIVSNSLVAGLTYTFQLSAAYAGFNASAYAQVTISMNSPPSGGSISVVPTTGTALSTAFYLVTTDWVDDASDYPFNYIFTYYTTTVANSVVIKNLDSKSYISSVLGQGLQGNNYLVTCIAIVMDTHNGSASVLTTVTVNPVANVSALSSQTAASLNTALNNYNPSAVAQIIGATTSSVNAANCTVPTPCWLLHRENCSFTALTCGVCLSGYIGVSGDSNVACFPEDDAPTTAACSTANAATVCASGKCSDSGVCVEQDKTCTNNCSFAVSGNGHCVFYDVNNYETETCVVSDSYCRAACACKSGFYGSDCSLTASELESLRSVRDALCVGLYKTLSIQDVTSDVVNSRATSIANILLDVSQLSDAGFGNCTAALIETIQGNPALAGSGSTATLCMQALSSVLQKGSGLSSTVVSNISGTLALLNNGIQSSMAIGQEPVEITTANVRMSSSLQTAGDISGLSFSPPLTAYEKYLGMNITTIGLNTSSSDIDSNSAVGVSVLQYTSNPHGKVTASRSTGLSVSAYSAGTVLSSRRRLSTSDSIGVKIVLNNINKESYSYTDSENRTLLCQDSQGPYNVTVVCPDANRTILCSGELGYVNYTCPFVATEPSCDIWDGTSYSASSSCSVISYTTTTTTCLCYVLTPATVAQGALDVGELNEFSSSANMVVGSFVDTFRSAGKLSLSTIAHNSVIFSLVVSILIASVAGVVIAVRIDSRELKARNERIASTAKKSQAVSFDELLLSWKPQELSDAPWHTRLWKKMLSEHEWISMFSGYHSIDDYRTTKFIQVIGLIINFMFIDTVMAVLFFYDDGTCETYTLKDLCLSQVSLDQEDTLCLWDADTSACSFNYNIGQSFLSTLILTGIITSICIPFQMFYESMVKAIRDYFCVKVIRKLAIKSTGNDGTTDRFHVDIEDCQTRRCTLFRAARLAKMQQIMDNVTVEEEAELLHEQIVYDLNRPAHELSGANCASVLFSRKKRMSASSSRKSEIPATGSGEDHDYTDEPHACSEDDHDGNQIEKAEKQIMLDTARKDVWKVAVREMSRRRSLLSHHFMDAEPVESLQEKIQIARKREEEILELMNQASTVSACNKILLQQFCASLLSGYRKDIAAKYFEYSTRESATGTKLGWYHYFSLVMFPCYILCTCLYIFLFGVRMGSHSTNSWLLGGLVSIVQDMFLLIPFKLYVKWIAMSAMIVADVRVIFQHIHKKSKLIMRRSRGLMKSANGMIHHLNPACRAARKHPGLAVSRLLISITDDDLPRNLATDETHAVVSLASVTSSLQLASFAVVLFVASLPDTVQDIVFEAAAVAGIGGILITLAALAKISVGIPVVVFIIASLLPMWYCIVDKRRQNTRVADSGEFKSQQTAAYVTRADIESPRERSTGTPDILTKELPIISPRVVVAVDWDNLMENWDEDFDSITQADQHWRQHPQLRIDARRQRDSSRATVSARSSIFSLISVDSDDSTVVTDSSENFADVIMKNTDYKQNRAECAECAYPAIDNGDSTERSIVSRRQSIVSIDFDEFIGYFALPDSNEAISSNDIRLQVDSEPGSTVLEPTVNTPPVPHLPLMRTAVVCHDAWYFSDTGESNQEGVAQAASPVSPQALIEEDPGSRLPDSSLLFLDDAHLNRIAQLNGSQCFGSSRNGACPRSLSPVVTRNETAKQPARQNELEGTSALALSEGNETASQSLFLSKRLSEPYPGEFGMCMSHLRFITSKINCFCFLEEYSRMVMPVESQQSSSSRSSCSASGSTGRRTERIIKRITFAEILAGADDCNTEDVDVTTTEANVVTMEELPADSDSHFGGSDEKLERDERDEMTIIQRLPRVSITINHASLINALAADLDAAFGEMVVRADDSEQECELIEFEV